jgi:hypothetical protein
VRLAAFRVALELPSGWEGRIYRRDGGRPIIHAANFALPPDDGDFATGATERMPRDGVVLVLAEYEPALAGTALFAAPGPPRIDSADLSPASMLRRLPGQAGVQRFFSQAGRAFSAYLVIGSASRARELVPTAGAVLATMTVERTP